MKNRQKEQDHLCYLSLDFKEGLGNTMDNLDNEEGYQFEKNKSQAGQAGFQSRKASCLSKRDKSSAGLCYNVSSRC